MQVRTPSLQHEVMIEAVENHMPQVIVIDEIGTELEAQAARTIAERGVQLIGTAHGNNLDNLMLNPTLSDLIGGIQSVTLGDEEARRRRTQKSVLERKAPPTFDVIIEIQDRERVDGPRRRRRDGRLDAARRPGRAGAALARRGRRPPLAGTAAAVAPRADRRGAVRRPRRHRASRGGWSPAGAATAATGAAAIARPSAAARSGAATGPGRAAAGARPAAGSAREAAPRGSLGGWLEAGTLPGARFAAAQRGASRVGRGRARSSPARSPIAARSSAAPATVVDTRPASSASSSARRPGATRRRRALTALQADEGTGPVNADELEDDDDDLTARRSGSRRASAARPS